MMKLRIVSTVGRCGGLFGVDPGLELLDEVLAFAVALVLLSWALLVKILRLDGRGAKKGWGDVFQATYQPTLLRSNK